MPSTLSGGEVAARIVTSIGRQSQVRSPPSVTVQHLQCHLLPLVLNLLPVSGNTDVYPLISIYMVWYMQQLGNGTSGRLERCGGRNVIYNLSSLSKHIEGTGRKQSDSKSNAMAPKQQTDAYVLGVGMTQFIKPRRARLYTELGYEAGVKAMLDAQINYDDVEMGVACFCYGDTTCGQRVFYQFGSEVPIYRIYGGRWYN